MAESGNPGLSRGERAAGVTRSRGPGRQALRRVSYWLRNRASASLGPALMAGCVAALLAGTGCQGPGGRHSGSAESAQLLYTQHCLGCHGATGEGLYGSNIQGLNRSIDQIVEVIADGRGKMPPFTGDLSKEQMRQLARYVKTFKYKP